VISEAIITVRLPHKPLAFMAANKPVVAVVNVA